MLSQRLQRHACFIKKCVKDPQRRVKRATIQPYRKRTMSNYNLSREAATELRELIEDTVEYFCDQNMVSGELAYTVVECIAQAKQAQMQGIVS